MVPSSQKSEQETHDPHPSYGLKATRGCTDVICLILFVAFWALLIFVAATVFRQGDPNRILYGIDYLGNICGHGAPNTTDLPVQEPWSARRNIWYPLQVDPFSNSVSIDSTVSLGICVETCPTAGQLIQGYALIGTPSYRVPWYISMYDSFPVLNRCVPNVTNIACGALGLCGTPVPTPSAGPNSTAAPTTASPSGGTLSIGGVSALRNMAIDSINELKTNWWVVLVSAIISTVLSFLWLFILRRTVKPLVVTTMFLLLAVLGIGGYLCYRMRTNTLNDPQADANTPKYWLAGAIACWVVDFLFLCVMLFLWRDVMVACDLVEEASKVVIKIPTMALVPLVCFLMVIPFVVWAMFVSIFIQTCGDTIVVPAPNVTIPGLNVTQLSGSELQLQNWRIPAHLYNLFMFLWTFGVINAICYMIIAMCAVFWYFSEPGDHKSPPSNSVFQAVCLVIRNHLGTIFFGAFIVAVIQIIRVILLVVEQRMSETLKKNQAVKGLLVCVHCVLSCLERVMKFINKNAYIMTAIKGTNFLESAQTALSLLVGNALTVGAITVISEYVMIFGKVLITGCSTMVCYAILKSQSGADALRSGVLILAIVALFAFFIACLFINIFSVCIDTVLLCYCADKADNSGKHYFPSDLDKHVSKQATKAGVKEVEVVNAEPLLELHNANPISAQKPKGMDLL